MSRQIRLGLFLLGTGSHISGWRLPGAIDGFEDIAQITTICREAERGLFDLIFVGDNLNANPSAHPSYCSRMEPLTMLSAIATATATATAHIGLGATSSTTYGDPWTPARSFASLDHISGGRAAWNAVTTSNPQAAANFGITHPDHGQRYRMSEEFIAVAKALWGAWDDGALRKDRESGRYFDASKIREINHEGAFFRVKGPVNISRSPQGQPLILQAGGSEPGQDLAAAHADVVFTVAQDRAEAADFYKGLKARLPGRGREKNSLLVLPGVMPVVGQTETEAREKLRRLMGFVDDTIALGMLSERFSTDLSGHDLDAPIPDLGENDAYHSFAKAMLSKAQRENMSLRDLYSLIAAARGHWVLCGSAEQVADTLQEWFETGAADGCNIMPGWFMSGLSDFIDLVVPILQQRGLFKTGYVPGTLREKLELPARVDLPLAT